MSGVTICITQFRVLSDPAGLFAPGGPLAVPLCTPPIPVNAGPTKVNLEPDETTLVRVSLH